MSLIEQHNNTLTEIDDRIRIICFLIKNDAGLTDTARYNIVMYRYLILKDVIEEFTNMPLVIEGFHEEECINQSLVILEKFLKNYATMNLSMFIED